MMGRIERSFVALLALSGVSALQIPLQLPLNIPEALRPWLPADSTHDAASNKPLVDSEELQAKINGGNLMKRAEKLYTIAQRSEHQYNHPTRVIGSEGHLGSLQYIESTLHEFSDYYNVSREDFPAIVGKVYESRLVIGNQVIEAAVPMSLTPPTKNKDPVRGYLVFVEGGCQKSDYPAAVKGNVVLVERGECGFGRKSQLAGMAGAITALIYNNEDGEFRGTLGEPGPGQVATFGLTRSLGYELAKELKAGEEIDVISYIDAVVMVQNTTNIIAQTVGGDPDNVVMLGGHSDGVLDGPGINDDGSGSMSILEVATQLVHFAVNNSVRFAWWSAEEEGLLGSDWYVYELPEEEKMKIRLFMDFDMMASPNFAYQIYNATNEENPVGSHELKQLFADWYEKQGLNYTFIPFDGRSDYDAFIRGGIPGGGIATGAEGVKTKEEEAMFGGNAGDWYDPCYHQICDDLDNLNMTAWEINTKLIAHAVATYAKSFDNFPKRTESFNIDAYDLSANRHGNWNWK